MLDCRFNCQGCKKIGIESDTNKYSIFDQPDIHSLVSGLNVLV